MPSVSSIVLFCALSLKQAQCAHVACSSERVTSLLECVFECPARWNDSFFCSMSFFDCFWSLNRDYAFDRSVFLIIYLSVKQVIIYLSVKQGGTVLPSAAFCFVLFFVHEQTFWQKCAFEYPPKCLARWNDSSFCSMSFVFVFCPWTETFWQKCAFESPPKCLARWNNSSFCSMSFCCCCVCPWTETVLRRKPCLTGWSLPTSSTWLLLLVACSATSSTTSTSM